MLFRSDSTKLKKKSLRKICQETEAEAQKETGLPVKVRSSTVDDRAKGKQSIQQFNAQKRWLVEEEEERVIEFAVDTAQRGFPLNYARLKEHVDAICKARLGNKFPKDGVGKEWTYRFVQRHSSRLQQYWSRPLDHAQIGRAHV